LYDRAERKREELTKQRAIEDNLIIIPPYDRVEIVAGQGTAAKELITEVAIN